MEADRGWRLSHIRVDNQVLEVTRGETTMSIKAGRVKVFADMRRRRYVAQQNIRFKAVIWFPKTISRLPLSAEHRR